MTKIETPAGQLNGLVKCFKTNRRGDVDAVEIDTDKGAINLKFPPHMAKLVMETIAIGQRVIADYVEKPNPEKKPTLDLKAIKSDKQADTLVLETIKPKKPSDNRLVESIKAETFTLVHDKKDEPVGIRVDDKLIHLRKDDKELAAAIRTDSVLTIQAIVRSDEGFVNEHNLPVYHIESIDIDGRSFHPSNKK
ncbi:hypothetical protein [Spirosoma agri]